MVFIGSECWMSKIEILKNKNKNKNNVYKFSHIEYL